MLDVVAWLLIWVVAPATWFVFGWVVGSESGVQKANRVHVDAKQAAYELRKTSADEHWVVQSLVPGASEWFVEWDFTGVGAELKARSALASDAAVQDGTQFRVACQTVFTEVRL